jgi:hypothetical protein
MQKKQNKTKHVVDFWKKNQFVLPFTCFIMGKNVTSLSNLMLCLFFGDWFQKHKE